MTIIGYARVSTPDQSLDSQVSDLEAAGCQLVFSEIVSGAKRDRPKLDTLMSVVQTGDTVVVVGLDRLGRSLGDLLKIVADFERKGVNLRSLRESIDTTSPSGRLVFHMFGAIAEFERSLILERTQRGLEAARKSGRFGGRPPALSAAQLEKARAMLDGGQFTREDVARLFDVHESTLRRALRKEGKA